LKSTTYDPEKSEDAAITVPLLDMPSIAAQNMILPETKYFPAGRKQAE
jgi:hypothetical protein